MNKKDLIDFEKRVQDVYESGKIKAPVHLSGNNEDKLIEIFCNLLLMIVSFMMMRRTNQKDIMSSKEIRS